MDTVISPLSFALEFLLDFFYSFSSSYGLSIIFLSLAVFTVLLPLYLFTDRVQKNNLAEKEKMNWELLPIQELKNSRERFLYTRYVYKKYKYHPIKSLKGLLSLLIQVPFFVAAYYMLSNYNSFAGQGFGVLIKDFSQPDRLLKGINFLPILMTLINVLSACCLLADRKNIGKGTVIQLFSIPLLFLVLLYNSPSALVLYWTMNNAFSLVKNYVQNRRVLLPKLQGHFAASREKKLWFLLLALFVLWLGSIAVWQFLVPFSGLSEKVIKLTVLFGLLASIQLTKRLYEKNRVLLPQKKLAHLSSLRIVSNSVLAIISVLLWFLILIFVSFWIVLKFGPAMSNSSETFWYVKGIIILLLNMLCVILLLALKQSKLAVWINWIKQRKNVTISFSNLVFLLFILFYFLLLESPIKAIASSPSEFDNPIFILLALLSLCIAAVSISSLLFYLTAPKYRRVYVYSIFYIFFYMAINYFIFNTNKYGGMDFFILHDPSVLSKENNPVYLDFIWFFIISIVAIVLYAKIDIKKILRVYLLFGLVLITNSSYHIYKIAAHKGNTTSNQVEAEKSLTGDKYFKFSKNGENVLVIFFDRFMGGLIPDILKDVPSIEHDFEGFTWYPNTLTFSEGTTKGLPPIYGGYQFTGDDFISSSRKKPGEWESPAMQEVINGSTAFILDKFLAHGWHTFINDPSFFGGKWYGDVQRIRSLSPNSYADNLIGKYTEEVFEKEAIKDTNNLELVFGILIPFSFFKISPPSMREDIYNDGRWELKSSFTNGWIRYYLDNLSLAYMYPKISSSIDNELNYYNFTTNKMTHDVYAALDNGKFQRATPSNILGEGKQDWEILYENTEVSSENLERFKDSMTLVHFFAAKEALVRTNQWFQWLKDEGVYDNTLIVIVGDHGRSIYNPMFPQQKSNDQKITYANYHPVFMVKELYSRDDFKIDKRFMTNADVAGIVLSMIDPQAKEKYSIDKTKGFRIYTEEGRLIVKDNIFDPQNWEFE